MFRFPRIPAVAPTRRSLLRRALLLGGAVLLLWTAVQVMPRPTAPDPSFSGSPAYSASSVEASEPALRPRSGGFLFSAGNIAALVLLLGGGGLAWHLRRQRKADGSPPLPIEMLGHLNLAPNQQLRLVRCGGEVLLLGVTAGQITMLKSYDDEAFHAAASVAGEGEASTPAQHAPLGEATFARLLRQQLGGRFNAQAVEAPC